MSKPLRRRIMVSLSAAMVAAVAMLAAAQGPASGSAPPAMPTLGGKQFWCDELFFHQWRIQRNVLTGHYRLLDEHDFRHASGTYAECRARLDQIRRERKLPPMQGKAVIVLHGLARSRSAMDRLCRVLREQGGYSVFNVSYASGHGEMAVHAQSLRRIIENLRGIEEINFVGHSMGNIVVRHYLGDQTDPARGLRPDPRIKRFVMLTPPNHGSLAALVLADNPLFKAATGDAGQQFGRDWEKLEGRLATPKCEFGIIAGGKGDGKGYNPLLPGDNDGVISVATTRLSGASDFIVVPSMHAFVMDQTRVQELTLRFLQKGYFVAADKRQPVP